MPIIEYDGHFPKIASDVFIAPNAWITGKVTIGEKSSVFFGVTMRGDIQNIIIGSSTNIQENVTIHTSRGLVDCIVGDSVTVGHGAILHGCKINSNCIIGMGAILLDCCEVGENCIIGANSLVSMRTKIPAGTMAYGSPAKVIRDLTEKELKEIKDSAASYLKVSAKYKQTLG